MPEPRLYDALQLTKQGKKKQAILIVRDVLRQDRENVAAWWMMANLLDDEEKILKCLYQLLQLNSEHRGARKKLAELRPDLMKTFVGTEDISEEVSYEGVVETPSQEEESDFSDSELPMVPVRALLMALVLIVIVFGIVAIIFISSYKQANLLDDNGKTPQQVTEDYIRAMWLEDIDAMYRLSCPEYYSAVDTIVADFSGYDYSQWTVDTSQTRFELFYSSDNYAYVTMNGVIAMLGEGQSFSVNWDDEAKIEGYAGYGEHLSRSNGGWQICVSRDVPSIQND